MTQEEYFRLDPKTRKNRLKIAARVNPIGEVPSWFIEHPAKPTPYELYGAVWARDSL